LSPAVKTVPSMPSSSNAVAESVVSPQSAMSPAPTSTGSPPSAKPSPARAESPINKTAAAAKRHARRNPKLTRERYAPRQHASRTDEGFSSVRTDGQKEQSKP
jgi:hypothetical protein